MTKIKNIPNVVPLDADSVLSLSVACAWLDVFPTTLRQLARLKLHRLHEAMASREIPPYGLLSAAYIGVAPLPSSFGRFITQAQRTNKYEEAHAAATQDEVAHAAAVAFRQDAVARENSAAGEYEMSRGELKRFFEFLDALAIKCAGVASYDALVNCKDEVLLDQSPFAPADRETYAEGPLYLWDFAKTVNEKKLADVLFDTFCGWVLFAHLEDGVVFGHAIHPRAHRFGNFARDPVIDASELITADGFSPIIRVPSDVQDSVRTLADSHFPNVPFEFVQPPLAGEGLVFLPKIHPSRRRCWTGV